MTIEELKAKCAEEYSPEEFGETLERFIDEFKLEYVPKSEVDDCLSYAREEGWNLAKKIIASENDGGYDIYDLDEIFGMDSYFEILPQMTYSEAFEKVKAWEKRLKRWDEVVIKDRAIRGIIVRVHDDMYTVAPHNNDEYVRAYRPEDLRKTDRRMQLV